MRRLRCLQDALGEPVTLCLSNQQLGEPGQTAIDIGGRDADYDIEGRSAGLINQAAYVMNGLRKGDVLVCRGARIAERLRNAGAVMPRCLRVLYVHDDPFPTSVADNDFAVGWLEPHIVFALQPGRLAHYRKRVDYVEWAYYGVDTELFYPGEGVPVKHDVAMGSHVPTKIYQVRFDWMEKLTHKCDAVIGQRMSYADYAELLSSTRIAVDIPNSRQMTKGGAWPWMVNYRAFEIAALGIPSLLPDLPGYRDAFGDLAHFYRPNYKALERSVLELLANPVLRMSRVARGLDAARGRFSLEVVTAQEASVIQSMRGRA